jgi:O-acetyl-ADP-ribose deacetylase (regulator of RNase III)
MIEFTTGNLFDTKAQALVNTVNCEGYMGKGIAYQFKLKYPENNTSYVKACKSGALYIGSMHYYMEQDKIIINFPTKDKWRAKSKMSYIDIGLEQLVNLIQKLEIKSIAIPPLGSGNGGLNWNEVKKHIIDKLTPISDYVDIVIYEPSKNYSVTSKEEPKLSCSALILMQLKERLNKFGALRLQKAAYFTNIFLGENYFKFDRYKFGPYANTIAIISKNIKEYQKYHGVKNTNEAYSILLTKLISKNITNKLNHIEPALIKATNFVNSILDDHKLECIATVTYIVQEQPMISIQDIIGAFNKWSKEKSQRFSDEEICEAIEYLISVGILETTLTGIILNAA